VGVAGEWVFGVGRAWGVGVGSGGGVKCYWGGQGRRYAGLQGRLALVKGAWESIENGKKVKGLPTWKRSHTFLGVTTLLKRGQTRCAKISLSKKKEIG